MPDSEEMLRYASFQTALREAKRPIALAGAGLSAASGIPTFRGAGGELGVCILTSFREMR